MEAVDFPFTNVLIGKGQNQYAAIPACLLDDPQQTLIMCFQLSPEERAEVANSGRVWIQKWTFGSAFQPIALNTSSPFVADIELAKNEDYSI